MTNERIGQVACAVIVMITVTALLLTLQFGGQLAITFAAMFVVAAAMVLGLPKNNQWVVFATIGILGTIFTIVAGLVFFLTLPATGTPVVLFALLGEIGFFLGAAMTWPGAEKA